jgi:hypothetical protein
MCQWFLEPWDLFSSIDFAAHYMYFFVSNLEPEKVNVPEELRPAHFYFFMIRIKRLLFV